MKNVFLVIIGLNLISCAKFSYLTSQSIEQIRLVSEGEEIGIALERKNVDSETKAKLKKIIEYKKFFSEYFEENIGEIYNKVIFLDREHVSHLVISSSWIEIKPIEECFWFAGCFPYLGFFHKKSAEKYRDEMISKGLSSHVRPVNAYSTLGHFNDRVLSSFFNYSEKGLANLIFHELIHSVIFFKNDVSFNENIASFFASELVSIYFKETDHDKVKSQAKDKSEFEINRLISDKTKRINQKIFSINEVAEKKLEMKSQIESEFGDEFRLELLNICKNNDLDENFCLKFNQNWTPSRLAAIGTYNQKQEQIKSYYENNFTNLNEFYKYLKDEYRKGTNSGDLLKKIKPKL